MLHGKDKVFNPALQQDREVQWRVDQIENILYDGNEVTAVLRLYQKYDEYFDWPVCSSQVGIWHVANLSRKLHVRQLSSCTKVWLVHPKPSIAVAVDLLH